MKTYKFKPTSKTCEQCHGKLPDRSSPTRKYCSDECKYKHTRIELKKHARPLSKPNGKCIICGVGIARPRMIYCSDLCKSEDPRTRVYTDVYKNKRIFLALPGVQKDLLALKAKWEEMHSMEGPKTVDSRTHL